MEPPGSQSVSLQIALDEVAVPADRSSQTARLWRGAKGEALNTILNLRAGQKIEVVGAINAACFFPGEAD
jgi:hypothetical protein